MGSHLNRVVTVRMPDVGFAASPRTQYIDERDRREAVETESRSMSVRPVVLVMSTLIQKPFSVFQGQVAFYY